MGENYVLGNRDDNNEFKPYKLDPRMFENREVIMMALGTMHAVALVKADEALPSPQLPFSTVQEAVPTVEVVAEEPAQPQPIAAIASQSSSALQERVSEIAQPVASPSHSVSKKRTLEEITPSQNQTNE